MEPNEETIRRLAHQLWEAGGRRNDSHESDWLRAERMIRDTQLSTSRPSSVDESVRESFPASDPPASHAPDLPPANADAKWAAARAAEQARRNEATPDRAHKDRKKSAKSQH